MAMRCKVSKTMANAIAAAMRERGMECEEVSVQTFSESGYVLIVAGLDGVYDAQEHGDYDWHTCLYKAIRIVWPYSYSAPPTYLTTASMRKVLDGCSEKNIDSFMDALCDSIAI